MVVDSMFVAVGDLFRKRASASVEWQNGDFVIGYREGRDVCVIARGKTWEQAFAQAKDRVHLVDRLLRDTGSNNAAVATAAAVPVRFVRIRRRDVGMGGSGG
jgi:hypothetical protein